MTKLMVKVSDKNKKFVLYNHLYAKTEPFSLDELQQELLDEYGLKVDKSFLKYEIEEYLDCGLVMHNFNKYISTMR